MITCNLLIVERNYRNHFKRNYLKNRKVFLIFLFHYWKLHKMLHILKKRISLITEMFWKFLTPENVFHWIPKSSCFRRPFASQSVRGSQALIKSTGHRFSPNFPLIQNISLNQIQNVNTVCWQVDGWSHVFYS